MPVTRAAVVIPRDREEKFQGNDRADPSGMYWSCFFLPVGVMAPAREALHVPGVELQKSIAWPRRRPRPGLDLEHIIAENWLALADRGDAQEAPSSSGGCAPTSRMQPTRSTARSAPCVPL